MSACLLCLSCLSVCLSVVYVYLFVCPSSTCLSVCLSSTYLSCLVCLSDGLNALSVCESDCPLACCLDLSVSRLSVDQSVCRSVCLSVSLTVGRSVCRPVGVSAGYLLRYSLSPNLSRLLSLSHILAQSLTFIHSHQLIRSNCREQAISLRWSLSQTHWQQLQATPSPYRWCTGPPKDKLITVSQGVEPRTHSASVSAGAGSKRSRASLPCRA